MIALEMDTKERIIREVTAGVALLDKALPEWPSRINVNRLEMNLEKRCVLGQCYGDYDEGLSRLARFKGERFTEEENFAFLTRGLNGYRQRTWKRVIRQRQAVPR